MGCSVPAANASSRGERAGWRLVFVPLLVLAPEPEHRRREAQLARRPLLQRPALDRAPIRCRAARRRAHSDTHRWRVAMTMGFVRGARSTRYAGLGMRAGGAVWSRRRRYLRALARKAS